MASTCRPGAVKFKPLQDEVKALKRTITFMQREKPAGYKKFVTSYKATIKRLERALRVYRACATDRAKPRSRLIRASLK